MDYFLKKSLQTGHCLKFTVPKYLFIFILCLGPSHVVCPSLPDGACRWGQWRAERPDVLFVLLHGGNADFEGGDVGQERPRGKRGLLPLFVLLRLQQWHKLDLDDGTGKTKHTPKRGEGKEKQFGWWIFSRLLHVWQHRLNQKYVNSSVRSLRLEMFICMRKAK